MNQCVISNVCKQKVVNKAKIREIYEYSPLFLIIALNANFINSPAVEKIPLTSASHTTLVEDYRNYATCMLSFQKTL
jgi:hypothetical protein